MASSPPRPHGTTRPEPQVHEQQRQTTAKIASPRSLLPAFEPVSSSPASGLPRQLKRKFEHSPARGPAQILHYPTPDPTSSTFLPTSSSPPQKTRPMLNRTQSTLSERQPLGTVNSVTLAYDGEPLIMGRSSNSSHYQLSANRLISRMHVQAHYRKPSEAEPAAVVLECLGWNGCKIHCCGQAHELRKGDVFTSDRPQNEILLDVQDARVFVNWPSLPRSNSAADLSDATWDDDSPLRRTPARAMHSSPARPHAHLESPISPTPFGRMPLTASATFIIPDLSPSRSPVRVYEDASGDEEPVESPTKKQRAESTSSLSDLEQFSDPEEENDPLIFSFGNGPGGENLLPRMASMIATSPERARKPLEPTSSPSQCIVKTEMPMNLSPIKNHVINQLAFSRLHALPLSTIMGNLPASMKLAVGTDGVKSFTDSDLKKLLDQTPCVGEIVREGKDAAGKALEDEFYYIPQKDNDEGRRDAVENSLGKPGLRAVRKQHKVGAQIHKTNDSNTTGKDRVTEPHHVRTTTPALLGLHQLKIPFLFCIAFVDGDTPLHQSFLHGA